MSSRVGQVFMWPSGTFALVTEGPSPPRKPGSSTPRLSKQVNDRPVHTLCVWGVTGVLWPVERHEGTLALWEQGGRRLA